MVAGKITLLGILQEDNNFLKDNFINNLPEGLIEDDFGINDFQKMCVMKTVDMEVLFSNMGTFAAILNAWSKMNKVSWENEMKKLEEINSLNMENVESEIETGVKNKNESVTETESGKETIENKKNNTETYKGDSTTEGKNDSEIHGDVARTTGGSDVTENKVSAFNNPGYVPKDQSTVTYGGTEDTINDSIVSDTTSESRNEKRENTVTESVNENRNSKRGRNSEGSSNEDNKVNRNRTSRKANDTLEYSKFVIEINSKFNIIDKIIEEFKENFFLMIY